MHLMMVPACEFFLRIIFTVCAVFSVRFRSISHSYKLSDLLTQLTLNKFLWKHRCFSALWWLLLTGNWLDICLLIETLYWWGFLAWFVWLWFFPWLTGSLRFASFTFFSVLTFIIMITLFILFLSNLYMFRLSSFLHEYELITNRCNIVWRAWGYLGFQMILRSSFQFRLSNEL